MSEEQVSNLERAAVENTIAGKNTEKQSTRLPYKKCDDCQKLVDITAVHCIVCNKCVKGFDHHCPWLNNCIGDESYRSFLALIFLYLAHGLFSLGIAVSVLFLERKKFGNEGDGTATEDNMRSIEKFNGFRIALSIIFIVIESLKSLATLYLILRQAHFRMNG